MNITLLADHKKYLCAEEGGGKEGEIVAGRPAGLLTATRDVAGAWETFEYVTEGDYVGLKSAHGQFACCENGGKDGIVVFRSPSMGAWEQFKAHVTNGGKNLALEAVCMPGYFIKAWPTGSVSLDRPMFQEKPVEDAGPYETFVCDPPIRSAVSFPLQGHVTLDTEIWKDGNGLFVPIGCHFGEAFSMFCRGRENEVQTELEAIRALGYDHVRVWDNLGYYQNVWKGREVAFASFTGNDGTHVPQTSDYYGRLDAFMSLAEQVGIRILWSGGDMNAMDYSTIQTHFVQANAAYSRHRGVVFGREVANEKWQNFPSELAEDEPAAVGLMATAFGHSSLVLYNSCPPYSGEEPSQFAHMVQNYFHSANVHGTRSFDDPEYVMRHHYNYGYERYAPGYSGKKYGMHSTEPGGPGQGVSVGNTEDVGLIVGMHAATIIGRSATVYMSGNGVFYDGAITPQPACKEVAQLRNLFHPHALSFGSYHGGRSEAWVTSDGGFADKGQGYARVDQLVSDSYGVGTAIAHSGKGTRRLKFKRNLNIEVFSLALEQRLSMPVSDGQVIDVGGDAIVTMKTPETKHVGSQTRTQVVSDPNHV